METYTLQQVDEMCRRVDRLADTLKRATGPVPREEQIVSEAVQVIQRMGEGIAWAYGQQQQPGLGERFAMPFVDLRTREQLKLLLTERRVLKRESRNRVAAQILQTVHILLQALPADSTLYCNLTAGWYLNDVVAAQLDFRENEDLLPLWMTVVKDIATMLNRDNMMLFFNPTSDKPFPIFSEAMKYYHHPVAQVRTHVQAISLEIFLKLRDEDSWTDPIFELVVADSSRFFTHVCCLLREFWRMADESSRVGTRRDTRNALYIQNDIMVYLNDIFACEIPQLSEVLQEKLLRFAIFPVLVRSALERTEHDRPETLSQGMAWCLLFDALTTLANATISGAVAAALLRPKLPEETVQGLTSARPRTPSEYLQLQAGWGQTGKTVLGADEREPPDEALYALSGFPLEGRNLARNPYLAALVTRVAGDALPGALLGSLVHILRRLRAGREELAPVAAEGLGAALCAFLVQPELRWQSLESALSALQELAAAADAPPGRARLLLGQSLQERVLRPLAEEVLQADRSDREVWLRAFQTEWAAHRRALGDPPPSSLFQRELLEGDRPDDLPVSARRLRVLLYARRLSWSLVGVDAVDARVDEMPSTDEAEVEEASRFLPGVSVHIGKMNRVKCRVQAGGGEEILYLVPSQALLVLVRPDEQKPFWAVPVVVEPLRSVSLGHGNELTEPYRGSSEGLRALRLEVSAPQSPFLHAPSNQFPLAAGQFDAAGVVPTSTPLVKWEEGGQQYVPGHTGPTTSLFGRDAEDSSAAQVTMSLVFSDERRRKVALKLFAQSRQAVCQRMAEGLDNFLNVVRDGEQ